MAAGTGHQTQGSVRADTHLAIFGRRKGTTSETMLLEFASKSDAVAALRGVGYHQRGERMGPSPGGSEPTTFREARR